MAYQVLARKWRPHDFSTLIGQDHVVKALTHALTHDRLHHAYLFTGTRGVGKTTISRILAKCLNCVGPDGKGGVTAEPCGVCEACAAIDQDRFVDYIEMDAASTRGIDDMVSLLERAKYAPTNARFKVYMIDEVHQLTTAAFNAMLKTLEEPPPYVKFILATTDPQKVPVTVLSRCLQFNLKSLPPVLIAEHMRKLLDSEKVPYETGAVDMIAAGARGSMRDGLSLLDQAIAFSAENLTVDSVREMLGTIDSTTLVRLLDALAGRNSEQVIAIADEIGSRSLSYPQALKDLALLLQKIAMAQLIPDSVYGDGDEAQAVRRLAQSFRPDEVQLYYQIAIHGRNEMNLAPDEYAGFTMTLLRMMAFSPYSGVPPKKPVVPAFAGATEAAGKVAGQPSAATKEMPEAAPAREETRQAEAKPAAESVAVEEIIAPQPEPEPVKKAEMPPVKPASGELPPWESAGDEKGVKKNIIESIGTTDANPPVQVDPASAPGFQPAASARKAEDYERTRPVAPPARFEEPPAYDYDDYARAQAAEQYVPGEYQTVPDAYIPASEETFAVNPVKEAAKRDDGPRVELNTWLEVAKKIRLPDSSQPLVEESELVRYEDNHMVLSTDMKALTGDEYTGQLEQELRKVLNPNLTLEVAYEDRPHYQTLKRLLKQDFIEEKKQKLDKIARNQRVQEIVKAFNAPLSVENVTLFDEKNNPRSV